MAGDSSSSLSFSSFSRPSFSNHSSADTSSSSSPSSPSVASDVLSVVPFHWEEKPGVSKHESPSPQIQNPNTGHFPSTSSRRVDLFNISFVPSDVSLELPPLRPPPRLQKTCATDSSPLKGGRKLRGDVGSQVCRKRRELRNSKLDDDPFWLAMKVCTKAERFRFDGVRTGMRDFSRLLKKKDKRCGSRNHCKGNSLDSNSLQLFNFADERGLHSSPSSRVNSAAKKEQTGVEACSGAFEGSGNRLSFRLFHEESAELPDTYRAISETDDMKVEGQRLSSSVSAQGSFRLTDVYRVRPARAKEPIGKSLLSDLFGCKSVRPDSVIDPSLYPLRRGSFRRPSVP